MTEQILVIGAGMAGLCTALAIAPTGRSVTLLERDGAPYAGSVAAAFYEWNRRGVNHLRHSHTFMARLGKIIKAEHPALFEDLIASGARELDFRSMLSPMQLAKYRPLPCDAEFSILTSRRTTFELVTRRYVERLANVTIKSSMTVRGLLSQKDAAGALKVFGVYGDDVFGAVQLRADLVVDASGKNGTAIQQLISEGARLTREGEAGTGLYFTRHYRLKPGQDEPRQEGNPPFAGNLDYLAFSVISADDRRFSVTLVVPDNEHELRKFLLRPENWAKIVDNLPGVRVWTGAERAEPVSKIFAVGNLRSQWINLTADNVPAVLGFFAVGDAAIQTNPIYGRGCTFAAVEAYILRDVLNETADPELRVLSYCRHLHRELRPHYDAMRQMDRSAAEHAGTEASPEVRPSLRARVLRSLKEDGVTLAMRLHTDFLRERMRGIHMLEPPDAWKRRPKNIIRILRYWVTGRNKEAVAFSPAAGPKREEMMRALGLSHPPSADTTKLPDFV